MRIKADVFKVDVNMQTLGAWVANLNDDDQAEFFSGMSAELKTWEVKHHIQMQFCAVMKLMKDEDAKFLVENVFCMFEKDMEDS